METTAFVLDLRLHAIGAAADPERGRRLRPANVNAFCSNLTLRVARCLAAVPVLHDDVIYPRLVASGLHLPLASFPSAD